MRIDLIVRDTGTTPFSEDGTFESLVGIRIEGHVIWSIPQDTPVKVTYQAGAGPAEVQVGFFADQVGKVHEAECRPTEGMELLPDAEEVIAYMVEHHINTEPADGSPPQEAAWRRWVRMTVTAINEMSVP